MIAFVNATQLIENFFRKSHPDESTLIIAEDRPQVRKVLKRVQHIFQGRDKVPVPDAVLAKFKEVPFKHIRDTLHFAAKADSRLLQVADICAFVIRGAAASYSKDHPDRPLKNAALFALLAPALLDFDDLLPTAPQT
jgi:hypothetical protein